MSLQSSCFSLQIADIGRNLAIFHATRFIEVLDHSLHDLEMAMFLSQKVSLKICLTLTH